MEIIFFCGNRYTALVYSNHNELEKCTRWVNGQGNLNISVAGRTKNLRIISNIRISSYVGLSKYKKDVRQASFPPDSSTT